MKLYIKDGIKCFDSTDYSYRFNLKNGFFQRWGKTFEDDPTSAPFPEILDIELDEVCHGIPDSNGVYQPCPFCYKANVGNKGNSMSFDTFKTIIDKFKKVNNVTTLTQLAAGVGDIDHCEDLFKMFDYCRSIDIIPNITINGARLTPDIVSNLVKYCGAISVSVYERNPEVCYDAIKTLTDAGMKQINIHVCYHKNNVDFVKEVINTAANDPRLAKLNAVVLLALKQKGRGESFNSIDDKDFYSIVTQAFKENVGLGFDSCSYHRTKRTFEKLGILKKYEHLMEPCESFGLFSSYINSEGKYFPCSFMENSCDDWKDGINVLESESFDEIWNSDIVNKWKNISLSCDRDCPVFQV